MPTNRMKFPHYKQLDSTDCGPSCIRSIADFYGKKYSLSFLRDLCNIGKDGITLLGICDAAENIGFSTNMLKISLNELNEKITHPCIIHWKSNHFVVLYAIKKKGRNTTYLISDPAKGLLRYKEDKFYKLWANCLPTDSSSEKLGYVLSLEPLPKFYDLNDDFDKNKVNSKFLINYILPHKFAVSLVILGIICICIISMVFPFLTQTIVDVGIRNRDINFVILILFAQVMISFGEMANKLMTAWLLLHVTARISISLISDFLKKLTRLPIAFFDSKKTGDILQRINDHQRIQDFLTGTLLSLIMALFIFIIYGFIMTKYDVRILIIFLLGTTLYLTWVLLFMKRRKKLDYMRFQESSVNKNSLLQIITGMQEIKLNGCEEKQRSEWEKSQTRLYEISIKNLSIGQFQEVGATFFDQIKNIIISFIAAQAVINETMTLGMMMALQYIIGQLNAPIKQFISFSESIQNAKLSMERLNEIHIKKDEGTDNDLKHNEIPREPAIEFNNVTFRYYGSHSKKVLKNINLVFPNGKTTAIVGTSGSGKTTLLKLILGFYRPSHGTIMLNNRPIHEYCEKQWRKNCGVVMQEGFIFSNTIKYNIGISDDVPDMNKIEKSVIMANLEEFIENLPLNYNTEIGSDGQGLSTGQKQRILIARAVYKNAPVLIFDEATNALDADNEKLIMKNLYDFFVGKTVIIVAHRLSTVKNADNIIVLKDSEVVEQGNHDNLVDIRGHYYKLIKNQLELGN